MMKMMKMDAPFRLPKQILRNCGSGREKRYSEENHSNLKQPHHSPLHLTSTTIGSSEKSPTFCLGTVVWAGPD